MQNSLEKLVDRIYADGLQKAGKEADRLRESAKIDADKIIAEAKADAAEILKEAERSAANLKSNVNAELKLAFDQTLSNLKKEIKELIVLKTAGTGAQQLVSDYDLMAGFISEIISKMPEQNFSIEVSESQKKNYIDAISTRIPDKIQNLEISGGKMKGGFTIAQRGAGYHLDFTDETLQQYFSQFIRSAAMTIFKNSQ